MVSETSNSLQEYSHSIGIFRQGLESLKNKIENANESLELTITPILKSLG